MCCGVPFEASHVFSPSPYKLISAWETSRIIPFICYGLQGAELLFGAFRPATSRAGYPPVAISPPWCGAAVQLPLKKVSGELAGMTVWVCHWRSLFREARGRSAKLVVRARSGGFRAQIQNVFARDDWRNRLAFHEWIGCAIPCFAEWSRGRRFYFDGFLRESRHLPPFRYWYVPLQAFQPLTWCAL